MSYTNAVYSTNILFGNPISESEDPGEAVLQNWLASKSSPIVAKAPAPSIYPVLDRGQIELSPIETVSAKFARTWGVPTRQELSAQWQSWEQSNKNSEWEGCAIFAARFVGCAVWISGSVASVLVPSLLVSKAWIFSYGYIIVLGAMFGGIPLSALAAFLIVYFSAKAIGRYQSGRGMVRNDIRCLANDHQTEAKAGQFDWLLESSALQTFLKYHKDDELEALSVG